MRKTILSFAVIGAIFFASCGSDGSKAETQDAQEVKVDSSSNSNDYTKIADGSNVAWRASHLAGMQPRWGKVFIKEANVKVNEGNITNAKLVMDMNSFTVENFGDDKESTTKLLTHLQSDDFFKVKTHPTSTFELTSIEPGTGEFNSKITGNLTILDATKSISFQANVTISETEVAVKSEPFTVDRKEWGLTYNTKGTKGVPTDYLIADEVGFTIDVRITK